MRWRGRIVWMPGSWRRGQLRRCRDGDLPRDIRHRAQLNGTGLVLRGEGHFDGELMEIVLVDVSLVDAARGVDVDGGRERGPGLVADLPAELDWPRLFAAALHAVPLARYDGFVQDPFGNAGGNSFALRHLAREAGNLQALDNHRNHGSHQGQRDQYFHQRKRGAAKITGVRLRDVRFGFELHSPTDWQKARSRPADCRSLEW